VAVGVNSDGRREVLGLDIGPSEAETFCTAFLRKLARRGLRGVKLMISDAHEGLKAAVARVLNAAWQPCRVHFMRNMLAYAGRQGRRVVSAFIATAFDQDDAETARAQWRRVANQLRPKLPKLAAYLDEPEADVLAHMTFPSQHRTEVHSTNPNRTPQRRDQAANGVVGIFPTRMLSCVSWERSCWSRTMNGLSSARYISLETLAPLSDDPIVGLPAVAS
jgi:putative transposase